MPRTSFSLDEDNDVVKAVLRCDTKDHHWTDEKLAVKVSLMLGRSVTKDEVNRAMGGPREREVRVDQRGRYARKVYSKGCAYLITCGKTRLKGQNDYRIPRFPQVEDLWPSAPRSRTPPPPKSEKRKKATPPRRSVTQATPDRSKSALREEQKAGDQNAAPSPATPATPATPAPVDATPHGDAAQLLLRRLAPPPPPTLERPPQLDVEMDDAPTRPATPAPPFSARVSDMVDAAVNWGVPDEDLGFYFARKLAEAEDKLAKVEADAAASAAADVAAAERREKRTEDDEKRFHARLADAAALYRKKAAFKLKDAFEGVLDARGRLKEITLEDLWKPLVDPYGDKRAGSEFYAETLLLLVQTPDAQRKTKNARDAYAREEGYRTDYEKAAPGMGGYRDKDGGPVYKRPKKRGADLAAWIDARDSKAKCRALAMAAINATATTGGLRGTIMGVLVSLAVSWHGNVTQAGQETMSGLAFSSSRAVVQKYVGVIAKRYEETYLRALYADAVKLRAVSVKVQQDNFAFLQWAAHKRQGEAFTNCASTISALAYLIPSDQRPGHNPLTGARRAAAMPPKFDAALVARFYEEHKAALTADARGHIDVDALADKWAPRGLFPREPGPCARLGDFAVLPSQVAKSSSLADFRSKVVPLMTRVMNACKFGNAAVPHVVQDVFLTVDPEPYLLADKAAKLDYEAVRHVFVTLTPFHLQKHGLEFLFTDPEDFLIFGEFLANFMDYRKDHIAKFLNKGSSAVPRAARAEATQAAGDDSDDEPDEFEQAVEALDDLDVREEREDGGPGLARRALDTMLGFVSRLLPGAAARPAAEVALPEESGADVREELAADLAAADDEGFDDAVAAADARPAATEAPAPAAEAPAGAERAGKKINFGRLRHFKQTLHAAFRSIRADLVKKVREMAGSNATTDEEAIDWACRTSERFLYLWNLFDNELEMWMQPFLDWDHGDARTVYANLPVMILHMIYYTYQPRWRNNRLASWLLSHLNATLYRIKERPDLVRVDARTCKHGNDVFIEHLNSVLSRSIPSNTKITPETIKTASCSVSARWRLADVMKRMLRRKRKPATPELLQDERRIRSPSFKDTLDAGKRFIWEKFEDELKKIADGCPTPCAAAKRNKAAIGLQWVRPFAEHYDVRLGRAKEPTTKTSEEVRAEELSVEAAVAKYKKEYTLKKVMGLSASAADAALKAMKVPGRGSKVKEGKRKGKNLNRDDKRALLAEFLGLAPAPAPAPA